MTSSARPGRAAGILFIVSTLLAWSSVCIFVKYFTTHIDGWTANGWRYGISALIWSVWTLAALARGKLPRGLWRAALLPALFNCCGQVCFAWAPYYIDASLMGFLLRTAVVSSTIGALTLFADERALMRIPAFWIGLVCLVGGTIGTVAFGKDLFKGGEIRGVLLGITGGLFFGLYAVSIRKCMHGISSITSFAAISTYTAVVLVVLMLAFAEDHGAVVFRLSGFVQGMLLLSALIGIAMAHVLYYAAIARLGVAVSSSVIQLAPFLGAAASVWLLGERMTPGQWLSGATMLCGAFVLLHAERRRAGQPLPAEGQSDARKGEDTEDGQTPDTVYLHRQRLPLSDG